MTDSPFPIIEKLISRAKTTGRTSSWLSDQEFRGLAHEVDAVMRERSDLIELMEEAGRRATE